ncbi:MAG TPA: FAD-binding oxidoreductase, partial [Candidatus Saccharimonadales bacterium]|nr:FAD-binding oxidoreductase [Candidatus Saccharimonadales bacterium]
MAGIGIRTIDGTLAPQTSGDLDLLRSSVRGSLCLPGEPGYDEARTIWNAMIDRRPAAVLRAAGAADVIQAVRFAADRRLLLSVRGGGHNIAGSAVCEGGLMLDLSLMDSIRVDPWSRTARVEPGVRLGSLDRETQAFGLATPLGINSTTGVAGLTLGGGFGWLSRKHGLTIDNLLSADIVTASGEMVRASDADHPDLFWAIRGGGGNLGVVTSFEFRLHPVGPQVIAGLIVHPFSSAREVLRQYRVLAAQAPDELCCWAVLRKAPPL